MPVRTGPRVGPVGAGLLLQPVSQAVLRRICLLDRVAADAAPIDELHAVHPDGRTLIRLHYSEFEPGCRAYGIHRGVFLSALKDAVTSQAVDVPLGMEIVDLIVRDDRVWLTTASGKEHSPFDFAIAADASRSVVRDRARLRARVMSYDRGALWATAPCDTISNKLFQVARGTRYLLGVLPVGGGRVCIGAYPCGTSGRCGPADSSR